ncbi:probable E3 ubiquitin-protein ligase TRIML1 [Dromiciops gliroides]|uniref:probable E3 ubiquitin-protein ligase TRIML1 n=1 Tax=Dromiciops gliroides TaxID=33562 RepID=UPI001CC43AB0|nr:probable E3 ubiquitin-protein ligase TRIML1 [Dromiciops gliroides]
MAVAHLAKDLQEEVTCPVCMDYFIQPVTLGCGHSFCRLCLLGSWEEVDQASFCPDCRRSFQMRDIEPNYRLRKLSSIARNLRPYLLQITKEKITCEKHKEEQTLFCEEDQTFLCASCFQSQEHRSHTVQPLHNAAKASRTQTSAWRESLRGEYRRLLNFLKHEEMWNLNRLAWDEKENLQKLKESEDRLSQHLQKLKEEIMNIEQNCQKPSLELLKVAGDTFRRIKSLLSDQPESARNPLTITCITGMFEMMNRFRVNVTLDPESASPYLIVSNDLKTVKNGGCLQNVPVSPARFEDEIILGAQVFTFGLHYWEVDVGDRLQELEESLNSLSKVLAEEGRVCMVQSTSCFVYIDNSC